ncbi:MAG: hypothetical protein QXL82_00615 [Candidatus Aenigmatarchaeota archaeon]
MKEKLPLLEKVVTYIIIISAILIAIGILTSPFSKSLSFWLISINSAIIFFSVFALILIIFLKDLSKK